MKKKVAIVMIDVFEKVWKGTVQYDELEDLASSVHEFLSESKFVEWRDHTRLILPSGKICQWDVVAAHYCSGKGIISESEFVARPFGEEQEGGVL